MTENELHVSIQKVKFLAQEVQSATEILNIKYYDIFLKTLTLSSPHLLCCYSPLYQWISSVARVFKAELLTKKQFLNPLLTGLLQKVLSEHILLHMTKCSVQASRILHHTLCSFISTLISHLYLIIIVLNKQKSR